MGRINAWWAAWNIATTHVTGAGFDMYSYPIFALFAPNPLDLHAAHSIYFQVLGEHGFIGLTLFIGLANGRFNHPAKKYRSQPGLVYSSSGYVPSQPCRLRRRGGLPEPCIFRSSLRYPRDLRTGETLVGKSGVTRKRQTGSFGDQNVCYMNLRQPDGCLLPMVLRSPRNDS